MVPLLLYQGSDEAEFVLFLSEKQVGLTLSDVDKSQRELPPTPLPLPSRPNQIKTQRKTRAVWPTLDIFEITFNHPFGFKF
jgi:hypothetical protein